MNPTKINLPLAIIVAGILIAGAVVYSTGGSSDPVAPVAGAPAPVNQPPAAQAGQVIPVDPSIDHIRGDKDAEVFVIEYSDFECPFCQRHHPVMQQLLDQNKGEVAWVYRHFPLSFHANAQKEAEATECANELGGNDAFWKYADLIFERSTTGGTGFPLTGLTPLAKEIGLDEVKFKSCLDSDKYAQHVQDDMAGGTAAGVSGTPGSIIWRKDGTSELIEGAVPLSSMQIVIDKMLQ